MKHIKLALAAVAPALAVTPALTATETKKEGVAERVKSAMGFGHAHEQEAAYQEGREAVKAHTTKIGEMKEKVSIPIPLSFPTSFFILFPFFSPSSYPLLLH